MEPIEVPIGGSYRCFVIAEIGQNHQGDEEIAKELITAAKNCGADCVKFQKSSLPDKFTRTALNEVYRSPNSFGKTYGEHKEYLEFSRETYKRLKVFAEQEVGIMFTASAMDEPSADFLVELGVPFVKIGSGDTNNLPLLERVARCGKHIVLSTGMQDFQTIHAAVETISKHHTNFSIMHCVSAYPTPVEDVNLSIMNLYRTSFPGIAVGYSGHEQGINIAIAAVAMGAKIIEKHFTKDNNLKGTDHRCSLNPDQFKQMVEGIRLVELAIGKPEKKILPSELPCQSKLGKSIVASHHLCRGTILTLEDLSVKVSRPRGIPPQHVYKLIGSVVKTAIEADSPITTQALECSRFLDTENS